MKRTVKELIKELQEFIDKGTITGDEQLFIPAAIKTATYHNLQDDLMIDLTRAGQKKVLIYGVRDTI